MKMIFSDRFRDVLNDDPIVYVDAGARGGLNGPWANIADARVYAIAFEPDPAACAEMNSSGSVRGQLFPKALWSGSGKLKVHLAIEPSTSSVYPPNVELLQRFLTKHAEPRTTEKVIEVEATSLDEALVECGRRADFLKIDTHSAEYEILLGAKRALNDSIFGVIVETWTTEVHAGQKLSGDILALMKQYGFELFDVSIAAAWHRRDSELLNVEKRQVTGLDLLFFKEPESIRDRLSSPVAAIKAAAIAELYGYQDLAFEILNICIGAAPANERLLGEFREQLLAVKARPTEPAAAPTELNVSAHRSRSWLSALKSLQIRKS